MPSRCNQASLPAVRLTHFVSFWSSDLPSPNLSGTRVACWSAPWSGPIMRVLFVTHGPDLAYRIACIAILFEWQNTTKFFRASWTCPRVRPFKDMSSFLWLHKENGPFVGFFSCGATCSAFAAFRGCSAKTQASTLTNSQH